MATKKNYSRYFIILQEDEKGYSTDNNKFPTGYAKVERKNDKCKVSYYVQNLKKSKMPYYMVIICDRKTDKRLVKLANISIDDYGRAEVSLEYNAENVADSGIPMESIKGASIVTLDGSRVHGILTGFISGTKLEDWKSYAIIESKAREDKPQESKVNKEQVIAPKEEERTNIFDEYEKEIENAKNIKKEEGTVPESLSLNKNEKVENKPREAGHKEAKVKEADEKAEAREESKIQEDLEVKEEKKLKESMKEEMPVVEEVDKEQEREIRDKMQAESDYAPRHKDEDEDLEEDFEEFFEHISKDLEEVKDVCKEVGKCKWYRINHKGLMNIKPYMDFNRYTMIYYPMFNYHPYIRRGGHYLFGYKYDSKGRVKYLVYGIPGTRMFHDQPLGGRTGFVTWVHRDDKKDGNGYWLKFYDFKNSTVVVPVKR